MFHSIAETGAFTIAAWAMIFARAGRLAPAAPAPLSLLMSTLTVGMLCLVPARQATTLVLIGLGTALLWPQPVAARQRRQAGLLLLGLALVWASSRVFDPLHVLVAVIDAHAAAALLHLAGISVLAQGNLITHGDFVLEVLVRCSSSAQFADVCLAFIVITLFLRGACRLADLPWLAAALFTTVILNQIRLSLMATGPDAYEWWHRGTGSSVYSLAATMVAAVFPLLAVSRMPGIGRQRVGRFA